MSMERRAADMVRAFRFEVFGKVQGNRWTVDGRALSWITSWIALAGVFFRKHTALTAEKLSMRGWVRNTERGTVEGAAAGPPSAVTRMKEWLRSTGSPKSSITRADFHDIDPATVEETGFVVRR